MYSDYYGFTARPFPPTPDPDAYFESASQRRALFYVGAGLKLGEGFVVLTGEIGAGKTTLIARLLATIDQDQVTTAQMVAGKFDNSHFANSHPADGFPKYGQTIPAVARAFGLTTGPIPGLAAETRCSFMLDANLCFLRDEARAGRRCLLVVDEAQALPVGALEALRLMSVFQLDDRPLLQILLVGHAELRARLQCHPDLGLLRQRVVVAHHLDPLEPGEVQDYIHHRLACVGWTGNPSFATDIHGEIHKATGGVPGLIDQLVDRLLLLGAAQQKAHIDRTMLSHILAEMTGAAPGDKDTHIFIRKGLKSRLGAALARCEGQIAELQQAVVALGDTSDGHVQSAHYHQDSAALRERIASLESQMIEQERTIRHTLTMLIDWIERDEAHGVAA